jgi:hypothetical protein
MLKLLFWGAIIYVVYRYFQLKAQLKAGNKNDAFQHHATPSSGNTGKKDENDYIDYEEIK